MARGTVFAAFILFFSGAASASPLYVSSAFVEGLPCDAPDSALLAKGREKAFQQANDELVTTVTPCGGAGHEAARADALEYAVFYCGVKRSELTQKTVWEYRPRDSVWDEARATFACGSRGFRRSYRCSS